MPDLSPETRLRVPVGPLVAVLIALFIGGGVYAVTQYRINGLETRVSEGEARRATDHELLVRIDERLAAIQRRLDGSAPASR